MTGTIINALAIIGGGLFGLLLSRGIKEDTSKSILDGLGLLVFIIGIQYAVKADNLAALGISLALGAVIGEYRRWETRLENLGKRVEERFGSGQSNFARAFVTASLLFLVGAMGIVGSLEDGLTGNYNILLVKSILDGIFSIIFSASMGIGVLFSALPVFIYQGSISLAAGFLKPLLSDPVLNSITSLGGLLIAALGLNIMGVTHIRVANLLPGIILVPFVMMLFNYLP